MRAKSILLLVLALGCGLVASIGITQVMAKRNTGIAVKPGESEAIYVAMRDVQLGDALTPQDLRLENWPRDKVPQGAISKLEDVEGRRTRTKLYRGEPILEFKLFGKGSSEQGATTLIPKGYRVVGVKVEAVSGGGLILPGDRVDVLVHLRRNPSRGIAETSTRTILQDIKVFAVNDVFSIDPSEDARDRSIRAKTISLLVTPPQAEVLMLASELGRIRLVMRSPEDDVITEVDGATAPELLGQVTTNERKNESLFTPPSEDGKKSGSAGFLDFLKGVVNKKVTPAASQRSEVGHWTMKLIKSNDVDEVNMEGRKDVNTGEVVWRSTETSKHGLSNHQYPHNPGQPLIPQPASSGPSWPLQGPSFPGSDSESEHGQSGQVVPDGPTSEVGHEPNMDVENNGE